jgi:hypothetical protein
MAGSAALADSSARLLNVDFGSWWELAVGFAAVGHTTNDVWNRYAAPWSLLGEISGAVWSDGTPSPVRIIVENAPGQWSNDTKDPMYRTYSYPHNGAPIIVTISNLPPALYDLYLYGHGGPNHQQRAPTPEDARQNSVFRVTTPDNGTFYGEAATAATEAWLNPVWKEGSQFVVFRKVAATEGTIEIVVQRGESPHAVISGMQLVETGKLSDSRADFASAVSVEKAETDLPGSALDGRSGNRDNRPATMSRDLAAGALEEEGNLAFEKAARAYERVIARFDRERPIAANAIFRLAECYRKLGRLEEANVQYARILREFPDENELVEHSRKFLAGRRR